MRKVQLCASVDVPTIERLKRVVERERAGSSEDVSLSSLVRRAVNAGLDVIEAGTAERGGAR